MRKLSLLLAAITCMQLSLSTPVQAAKGPLEGRFGLGYSDVRGNTEESKLNFDFDLSQQRNESLKFKYNGLFLRGKANDELNADKRSLGAVAEFIKTDDFSWYAGLGYLKDEFAGYKRELSLELGCIHYFIKENDRTLSGNLGVEFTKDHYTDDTKDDKTWLRLGFDGKTKLAENVHFKAHIGASAPSKDWDKAYKTDAWVGLTFTINKNIDTDIKYMVDFNKSPVDGKERYDRTFITSISYKI